MLFYNIFSPLFILSHFFLGPSAFANWTYEVKYSTIDGANLTSVSTRELNVTLSGLQTKTAYSFSLSAAGPGGEQTAPEKFIFQTKPEGLLQFFVCICDVLLNFGNVQDYFTTTGLFLNCLNVHIKFFASCHQAI